MPAVTRSEAKKEIFEHTVSVCELSEEAVLSLEEEAGIASVALKTTLLRKTL